MRESIMIEARLIVHNDLTNQIIKAGYASKEEASKIVYDAIATGGLDTAIEKKAKELHDRRNKKISKKEIYESLGMKKVKGSLGGTYYE